MPRLDIITSFKQGIDKPKVSFITFDTFWVGYLIHQTYTKKTLNLLPQQKHSIQIIALEISLKDSMLFRSMIMKLLPYAKHFVFRHRG